MLPTIERQQLTKQRSEEVRHVASWVKRAPSPESSVGLEEGLRCVYLKEQQGTSGSDVMCGK